MSTRDKREPVLIYLADLTHEGTGRLAVDMFPYNIGLVASYAKKVFGDDVEIKLFKYVAPFLRALGQRPPRILGCSNYCWNTHLAEFACEQAKSVDPSIVTVQGGTNYPFEARQQREFLAKRAFTDFHVFYEGEIAFTNLVRAYLEADDPRALRERSVDGCQSVSLRTGHLVTGRPVLRLKSLDEIPSPYTTGLLDEFFDGRLIPILETNRGCPFTCNFCNAGADYYTKVNFFSVDYLRNEWEYVASRVAKVGIGTAVIADNNFGMYPRDAELCRILKDLQERYGWPMRLLSTTGKNRKERIIEATEILGDAMSINMSVQSMDRGVLENIRRQNVDLNTYRAVNEMLLKRGRVQKGEMIACLPGETAQSFLDGLRQLMDMGVQQIYSYTLQLLPGTEYDNAAYLQKWGYTGKWRIVPFNFGEYEGRRIFDIEEVAVSSKTLSFEDYLKIRMVCLLTEAMYNDYQFYELVRHVRQYGRSPMDWIFEVLRRLEAVPAGIRGVTESFLDDTKSELFDTEDDLVRFFQQDENYQKLLRGERGHNVVFTHKGILLGEHLEAWIAFISRAWLELLRAELSDADEARQVESEVAALRRYITAKWAGALNLAQASEDIVLELEYDVGAWVVSDLGRRLREFKREHPVVYRFYFSDDQLRRREGDIARYGVDRLGRARLFARIAVLKEYARHVEHVRAPLTEVVTRL